MPDTWGGSWGTSWGTSWERAVVARTHDPDAGFFRRQKQRYARALQEELERQVDEPEPPAPRRRKWVRPEARRVETAPVLAYTAPDARQVERLVRDFRIQHADTSVERLKQRARKEFERMAARMADEDDAITAIVFTL